MKNKTALIIIDVQKGFDDPYWGKRNNPQAEKNIAKLLHLWRKKSMSVFHVQHHSRHLELPLSPLKKGVEIKDEVKPIRNEPIFTKQVNSAFIGTDLEIVLKDKEISDLVFVGLTTDHCVSTSVRMGDNLGFTCTVVEDASATFDRIGPNGKRYKADQIHELALVSLHDEFARIISTVGLMKSLIKEKPSPQPSPKRAREIKE